jgi:protein-disulfide isomerase
MLLAVAKVTGLVPAASAHGIPPVRAQMCLKDASAALGLAKMEQAASKIGVDATPTIFVNGKQVPAYDWDTLQPFLKEAGG